MILKKNHLTKEMETFYERMSPRARNCLERLDQSPTPKIIADEIGYQDLLKIRNLGKKSANEIAGFLEVFGYIESASDWKGQMSYQKKYSRCPHCGRRI